MGKIIKVVTSDEFKAGLAALGMLGSAAFSAFCKSEIKKDVVKIRDKKKATKEQETKAIDSPAETNNEPVKEETK